MLILFEYDFMQNISGEKLGNHFNFKDIYNLVPDIIQRTFCQFCFKFDTFTVLYLRNYYLTILNLFAGFKPRLIRVRLLIFRFLDLQ